MIVHLVAAGLAGAGLVVMLRWHPARDLVAATRRAARRRRRS